MMPDTRLPGINELKEQMEREAADRLRRALKRVTKRQQWLAFYGFPLDRATDDMATPHPDDMPADYNDGKPVDYE